MANPRIIPKKSAISKVPSSSDLVSGEVAVNYADQQWYGKHPSTGAIVEIGAPYLHSHDQLLSEDKNTELELNNSGQIVVTDNSSAKTFTLPSASGTIATLSDITASVAGVTSVNTRTGAVTLTISDIPGAVSSSTTGMTGATALTNIVQITQSGYNALGASVSASTLYIIVG